MKEFLGYTILDNSIQRLLIVFSIIALVIILKKILSNYLASASYLMINKAWKTIDKKEFSELFLQPLSGFLIITIGIITISELQYPLAWKFNLLKVPFEVILQKIAIAIFLFSFVRLVTSIINFVAIILTKRAKLTIDKGDDQLVIFFRDFIKVLVWIAGSLLILKVVFYQNIGNLLTGLSIAGAALALSARESLENLIASFIIFFDKPFYVGDILKVNNITGTVESIGLRSTRIRTADKTLVTVPNKQMVDSVVDNWSMRTQRRAELKLEFGEKNPASSIEQFVQKAYELFTSNFAPRLKSYTVFFTEFSKNGSTITIEYFTDNISISEFNTLKQQINLLLLKLIDDQKIELATSSTNINIGSLDTEAAVSKPII
ncbi:MAG: mechanosensitive ion channel family protein [Ferruginibacter sp.]